MGHNHDSHVLGQFVCRSYRVCPGLFLGILHTEQDNRARLFLGVAEAGLFPGVSRLRLQEQSTKPFCRSHSI